MRENSRSGISRSLRVYHSANDARLLTLIAGLVAQPRLWRRTISPAAAKLALQVTTASLGETCRRVETTDPASLASVSLHRTFHDDFDEHPLSRGRWVPHYAGGAAWPEARYWGGDGSDFKRKTAWNGEQQIYVDPRYGGRETTPLGLDPFKVRERRALDRRQPHAAGAQAGAVQQ